MSTIDPPAGWDEVDGINTNERLLGGPSGPLNRAVTGLTARTKQLLADLAVERDRIDAVAAATDALSATQPGTPIVSPGASDAAPAISAALAAGRAVRLLRGQTYNVLTPITAPAVGCEIVCEEGALITGAGSGSFLVATGGTIRLQGGRFSGFSQIVGFATAASLDRLVLDSVTNVGTVNAAAASVGALVAYFAADVFIGDIQVRRCQAINGREGFLFRGTWNTALVEGSDFDGVQHYSIRLGQDRVAAEFGLQGHVQVTGNRITNMRNPVTGAGSNECDGIAVFAHSANVQLNYLRNIDSAGADDCEGIYVKVRHGLIGSNVLCDCGRREGSIVIKGVPAELGTDYVQNYSVQCYFNVVWFTLSRTNQCSISIQANNVDCAYNWTMSGRGVTEESSGIELKYRAAFRNVAIRNNVVNVQGGAYGILVWAYGENVSVVGNRVYGAGANAIRITTRASTDVRYPVDGIIIGKNFTISQNEIYSEPVGAQTGNVRGLEFAINTTAPISFVRCTRNLIVGPHTEYAFACNAGGTPTTGSQSWVIDSNDFSSATGATALVNFFTPLPNSLRVRNNLGIVTRSKGADTVAAASATKTTASGILPALATYLTLSDLQVTPSNADGATRQLYVSAANPSGTFVVTAVGAGGAANFVWAASVEDKLLNTT